MFYAEFGGTKEGIVASASGILVASTHAFCSQRAWGQSRPWPRSAHGFLLKYTVTFTSKFGSEIIM